jgi:para-nitrobenzyl esterase
MPIDETETMNARTIAIDAGLLALPEPLPSGVRCFRGIRYAAAPVGALRWRPPQSVEPWSGVRPTDVFGPNSMQGVVFDDIDPLTHGISEDCLYLNVWTPSLESHEPLAVMVWIHGGGFVVGSGGEPRYDGANLAAKGIVVVTLNHRLNALGFFAHPDLTAESPDRASGNYGMLDLIAALQWVAHNIGAFGGDPGRVTIAGESAGSMAVSALMASPMARGLFARAIGESGALFPSPSRSVISLDEAERAGVKFARELGAVSLAELRAMPAASILAASPGVDVRPFRPIVDGYFLPRPPSQIFADGAQNDVPLLAGWNKDEGFNFSLLKGGEKSYGALTRAIFGERSGAALALYPSGSPETDKASARVLGGDLVIIHPTWAWIEAQKRTGRSEIYRFPIRPRAVDPRRMVRRNAECGGGRVPRRRIALCVRQSPCLRLANYRDGPRDCRHDFGLLDELRQNGRSQWDWPACLAFLSSKRRALFGDRSPSRASGGDRQGAARVSRARLAAELIHAKPVAPSPHRAGRPLAHSGSRRIQN